VNVNNSIKCLIISVLTLCFAVFAPNFADAQAYHTNSKKAVKHYLNAKKQYDKRKYSKTMKYLGRALAADADFADALLLKAELSLSLNDDNQAITCYERIFASDSMAFPRTAITLAKLYMKNYRFSEAVNLLQWYVKVPEQRETFVSQAINLLENAEFRDKAFNNPVAYAPVNLGDNVNTDGDEYVNQILPDGSRVFFTRRSQEADKQGFRDEFIYSSAIINGEYMPAVPLEIDWHNKKRMGAVSISANKSKMFFVGIDFIDSYGRGDIYESEFVDNEWTKPLNLGNLVNTSAMESQPCISADGMELYFVRYSRTYESTDIYVSEFHQGKWSNPKPVKTVNSKGNEMSPFIHPDGNTLYFASDGLPGMGGYDIFMCKKLSGGEWSKPVNLGYPVNSEKDEISFVVTSDGKKAYISSERDGGMGGFDIYVFDLDEINSPEPVDVELFTLRNINFEFNSAILEESSYTEIDSLAAFMFANPSVNIEISGFTDNSGSDAYNYTLSLNRANAVKNALVERDVNEDRMEVTGFGKNWPLVPNDSEENRFLNRRVEVRVIH